VDLASYDALMAALSVGTPDLFEQIPMGGNRKLTNPQAGLAFDLEGSDSHHMGIPPAPRIDGPEAVAELAENYWMALARDVNFEDYERDPLIAAACEDLSRYSDFRGPKEDGRVTPRTIFRGVTEGDTMGPYLSQFLLADVPFGSLTISQRQTTTVPGVDYVTYYDEWLRIQNGVMPGSYRLDPTPRYIRNLRDLGQYVHVDALYEAYLNASLILLGTGSPFDSGNPYFRSETQDGFGTFGGPHILSLVTEVATRALKAVWYQKWFVHRRLRPEAFAGLVHHHLTGAMTTPVNSEIFDSPALVETYRRHGSYLLPMGAPEGSPLHPSYGAGHATVAGACVTILKAFFNDRWKVKHPVVPSASGRSLAEWKKEIGLSVGHELDKLAANIAIGRNALGVHYRSDYLASIRLGEELAIGVLEEQKSSYNETATFSFNRFDGTRITI
jgi:membrane-associated phospholipid phosphatase